MSRNPFIDSSAKHTQRYIESNGAEGHEWNGIYCLLLSTRGRKTGKTRTIPLIYGKDENSFVVVASKGGHSDDPYWYKNLVNEPKVEIQVGPTEHDAVARTSKGKERQRLWTLMTDIFPRYEEYRQMTSREIPVVVIQPSS